MFSFREMSPFGARVLGASCMIMALLLESKLWNKCQLQTFFTFSFARSLRYRVRYALTVLTEFKEPPNVHNFCKNLRGFDILSSKTQTSRLK